MDGTTYTNEHVAVADAVQSFGNLVNVEPVAVFVGATAVGLRGQHVLFNLPFTRNTPVNHLNANAANN